MVDWLDLDFSLQRYGLAIFLNCHFRPDVCNKLPYLTSLIKMILVDKIDQSMPQNRQQFDKTAHFLLIHMLTYNLSLGLIYETLLQLNSLNHLFLYLEEVPNILKVGD